MQLRELFSNQPGKCIYRDYEDGQIEAGKIRVNVSAACPKHGTELTHFKGIDPFQENYFNEEYRLFLPDETAKVRKFSMRPGNMWVGNITELGAGVEGLCIGQRVAGYGPIRNTHTLPAEDALIMNERMTWKEAVCFDPAQFALGGVRDGKISTGDNVAIFGLGAIGLIAAQMAKIEGARLVIVVDPIECRRNAALENGADIALDPTKCDAGYEIKKLTQKRGADVIIESSGSYVALQSATRGIAYNGNISVIGWYKECKGGLDLGREAHFNQPNILISRACSEPNRQYPRWDFKRICDTSWEMLSKGLIKCENIVNPVVPFNEAAAAYENIVTHPEMSVKLGVSF
ncbi:MAG: zinc-dependent alcohol dehydrogenase [Ruminiclostridium sp.]